jgi:hypothetical protein
MNNELIEQIRKKNQEEAVIHELRRQAALNKVRELRRLAKEKENGNVIPQ